MLLRTIHRMLRFYGEGFLAPNPTCNLEYRPL